MELIFSDLNNLKGRVISYAKYKKSPYSKYCLFYESKNKDLEDGDILAKIAVAEDKNFNNKCSYEIKNPYKESLDISSEDDLFIKAAKTTSDVVFVGTFCNLKDWERKTIAGFDYYFSLFYPQRNNKNKFGKLITYDDVDETSFKNYINEHFIKYLKKTKNIDDKIPFMMHLNQFKMFAENSLIENEAEIFIEKIKKYKKVDEYTSEIKN